jgi:hypothetical protein
MPTLLHKSNGHLLRKANGHLAYSIPVQWYRVSFAALGIFRTYKNKNYSNEVPPYNYNHNPATYYDPESYYTDTQAAGDTEFAALTSLISGDGSYKETGVGSLSEWIFRGTWMERRSQVFRFSSLTPVDSPEANNATGSARTTWGILRARDPQEGSVTLSGAVTGFKNLNQDLAGTDTGLSFGVNFGAFATAAACTANFAAATTGSGAANIGISVGGLSDIKALMTTDNITSCAIKVGVGFYGSLSTYFGSAEYYGPAGDPWLIIATGRFTIRQSATLVNLWIKI